MMQNAEQQWKIANLYERAAADHLTPPQLRAAFGRKAKWFRMLAHVKAKREASVVLGAKRPREVPFCIAGNLTPTLNSHSLVDRLKIAMRAPWAPHHSKASNARSWYSPAGKAEAAEADYTGRGISKYQIRFVASREPPLLSYLWLASHNLFGKKEGLPDAAAQLLPSILGAIFGLRMTIAKEG
jgi:hypothetical protein